MLALPSPASYPARAHAGHGLDLVDRRRAMGVASRAWWPEFRLQSSQQQLCRTSTNVAQYMCSDLSAPFLPCIREITSRLLASSEHTLHGSCRRVYRIRQDRHDGQRYSGQSLGPALCLQSVELELLEKDLSAALHVAMSNGENRLTE